MMLKAGIIGCGFRGQIIARILDEYFQSTIEVKSLVDPDKSKAKMLDGLYEGRSKSPRYYKNMAEMWKLGSKLDMVFICTNPPLHHSQVMQATKHKSHIFCEKPLCLSPSEADDMVRGVERANIVCVVDYETVYSDAFRILQAYMKTDGFGKLLRVVAHDKGRPPAYDLETCAPHYLHAFPILVGAEPIEVTGRVLVDERRATKEDICKISELYPEGRSHDTGIRADSIEATYMFANGVTAHYFFSALDRKQVKNAGDKSGKAGSEFMHMRLFGTRGQLKFFQSGTGTVFFNPSPQDTPDAEWQKIPNAWDFDPDWTAPTVQLIQDFLKRIEKPYIYDPYKIVIKNNAIVIDMAYGIYTSHFAGSVPMKLPLADRNHPLLP